MRPIGPGRLERDAAWQEPANATEELVYAGLIFRAFYTQDDSPGEFFFIPDDLVPLLPKPQVEPASFVVDPAPTPDQRGDGGSASVLDLFTFLVYLQNHDVRPYADGRLAQRDLSALHKRLVDAGERRFALLRHLAERLGFLVRRDGVLRLDAAPVKRWLTASPGGQMAALQKVWRDDPGWNDLCQVPALECVQETPWQNDPVATRKALLALLARCPSDTWWTAASFATAVKETHPDFQRPDGDYTSWYIRDTDSGEYLAGFESWDRVEGALIADLLTGPLHWLGVVTTVLDEAGPICRLTETGARLLGLLSDEPEMPPSPPIIVSPDFRIEVPAPVSLYTRFQLERFAEPESTEPYRYRLTVGSLGRALARDIRLEQILAFLRQASEDRVPVNVAGQLQLWAGRFGQVQLEEMALLTAKNERVLKELSVLPETRSLISRVLSPTSALVRKQHLPRLRKELRALGFLPPED
jgi:hypothetical protein